MLSFALVAFVMLVPLTVSALPVPMHSLNARKAQTSSSSPFAASGDIEVSGILEAVKNAKSHSLAQYHTDVGSKKMVEVYGDLTNKTGDGQSIFTFMADMDIDCDGSYMGTGKCGNDGTGQKQTSWGKLDANKVPWIVIPEDFKPKHYEIKENALAAVICNQKMFYAIFGDQNGSATKVIGEASLLLAQTCFPGDGINANSGHDGADVAYIVFGSQEFKDINSAHTEIDIEALKSLGDKQMGLLQKSLGLGGGQSSKNEQKDD